MEIPEAYGGLEMDKVTAAVIADNIAKYAGFATTWGAHSGIGTAAHRLFRDGRAEKEISAEAGCRRDRRRLCAFGSLLRIGRAQLPHPRRALARWQALHPERRKDVDHQRRLCRPVHDIREDRWREVLGIPGGADISRILGRRRKNTRWAFADRRPVPLILNDCKVPVENLLGEIGKGHIIAFNILNIGRFKLGAMCVGGARVSVENAVGYAKQRKAFGKVIADFGLVREKIANMATLIYVGESLVYRTVGMMDDLLSSIDKASPDAAKETRKAIEEYAVECSILKVWGSEMIDYVVDETLQIYAGYGFVEEYPAERAYRDARINRIFEGTNEINRLIITGFLLKRAMSGQLPLMPAIKKLMDEVLSGPSAGRRYRRAAGGRAQAGRQRQETRPVCRRRSDAEIHDGDSGPAGSDGRHRRYDDRDLRHGDRPCCARRNSPSKKAKRPPRCRSR